MIEIKENTLNVEIYLALRRAVNWKKLSQTQAERALAGSLYTVLAYVDEKPVGMG